MGFFIDYQRDWKIVELSGLKKRFYKVTQEKCPCITLYLYEDPINCIIYSIMTSYKNYPNRSRTATHNQFNKAMAKLNIELKHRFVFYQNL